METFNASYLKLYRTGMLQKRAEALVEALRACRLCPRRCGVNRLAGEVGICRTGRAARVASFQSHFGEEAPLVGSGGSGTIFFSSCNLLCSFCQNCEISHRMEGTPVDKRELAAIMLSLQGRGCHNINLVSPTHVVPQIVEALIPAIEQGLRVPIVYNTGSYDAVDTLRHLSRVVDIYMPDFKFWDNDWGERFCRVSDYRQCAALAIREMHRQVGDLDVGPDGLARRGLLVRHLVMPGGIAGTAEIMHFLAEQISTETYVNIMAQYHPAGEAMKDSLLNRLITRDEFAMAIAAAVQAGLRRLDHVAPG